MTSLTQHKDDSWTVHTVKGDIDCEIVVNGNRQRVINEAQKGQEVSCILEVN